MVSAFLSFFFPPLPFFPLPLPFSVPSPPATRTPGHGVWKRTGFRTFDFRHVFYSFDAGGVLIATFDWHSEAKLTRKGDKFEGVSRMVRTDTAGNEMPFCATMEAERITL